MIFFWYHGERVKKKRWQVVNHKWTFGKIMLKKCWKSGKEVNKRGSKDGAKKNPVKRVKKRNERVKKELLKNWNKKLMEQPKICFNLWWNNKIRILKEWWKRGEVAVKYIFMCPILHVNMLRKLEGTARYAGLLLAPAEGFGLRPRLFLPFGQKKSFLCSFGLLRPFLVFSSNLSNFE